jgi:glutamate synthase domain-containing protein 3
VRNSGAIAVVEGAGNHGCEYMTGGIVVVLGRAGRNFGAGMSNGIAYVLDEAGTLHARVNQEMVALEQLDGEDDEVLHRLVHEHEERTASPRARQLLVEWDAARALFRRVVPQGAPALVAATRAAFLRATLVPEAVAEVRRSA